MITEETRDEMVEAFRRFLDTYDSTRARIDWIFERVGHDRLQGLADLAKRVEALEQQASVKAPSNVVHPISPEHPLVVGDTVRSEKYGEGVVTERDGFWYGGVGILFDRQRGHDFDPKTGRHKEHEVHGVVTRVAHASQSEPAPDKPAHTRPLQVGDRVRNAAGTDTGVVTHEFPELVAVKWDSGYKNHFNYRKSSGAHIGGQFHSEYGHVVLLEPLAYA